MSNPAINTHPHLYQMIHKLSWRGWFFRGNLYEPQNIFKMIEDGLQVEAVNAKVPFGVWINKLGQIFGPGKHNYSTDIDVKYLELGQLRYGSIKSSDTALNGGTSYYPEAEAARRIDNWLGAILRDCNGNMQQVRDTVRFIVPPGVVPRGLVERVLYRKWKLDPAVIFSRPGEVL